MGSLSSVHSIPVGTLEQDTQPLPAAAWNLAQLTKVALDKSVRLTYLS